MWKRYLKDAAWDRKKTDVYIVHSVCVRLFVKFVFVFSENEKKIKQNWILKLFVLDK